MLIHNWFGSLMWSVIIHLGSCSCGMFHIKMDLCFVDCCMWSNRAIPVEIHTPQWKTSITFISHTGSVCIGLLQLKSTHPCGRRHLYVPYTGSVCIVLFQLKSIHPCGRRHHNLPYRECLHWAFPVEIHSPSAEDSLVSHRGNSTNFKFKWNHQWFTWHLQ